MLALLPWAYKIIAILVGVVTIYKIFEKKIIFHRGKIAGKTEMSREIAKENEKQKRKRLKEATEYAEDAKKALQKIPKNTDKPYDKEAAREFLDALSGD